MDWDARAIGLSLAGVGACSALVQGTARRAARSRHGERRVLIAGLLAGALGFAIYGLAPTGLLFMSPCPWSRCGASPGPRARDS